MKNTIILAQLNPIIGDIEYNCDKAFNALKYAKEKNAALIIFPELFMTGYSPLDIIRRYPLTVEKNMEYLNKFSAECNNISALMGFCEVCNTDCTETYFNSVAFIKNGKIEKIIRKSVLSDNNECFESRYFTQSETSDTTQKIINLNSTKIAVLIGDEIKDGALKTSLETQNPDIIINIAATTSRNTKEYRLNKALAQYAKDFSAPLIHVNQTGAQDCAVYSGTSRAYNTKGELIARAKSFEEDLFELNLDTKNKKEPLPKGSELLPNTCFSLDYEPDLERTYLALCTSIKDYFGKNGIKRAVLGLSGGLDSSVCAALACFSLGAENVTGVSMPSKITSCESKNDARVLAKNLGLNFYEIPIKDMTDAASITFNGLFSQIQNTWGEYRHKNPLTFDNIQARSRATILWGITNEFSSATPIATSDKSELYMGYATINGDMSGGFAPICDVTKTKLFALARWINKNIENVIPESILEKPPGAELAINPKTGRPLTAEEALMPYEFLDEIIWRVENLQQNLSQMLDEEFIYETKNRISKEQKLQWLKKFAARVQFAGFKGTIMPPGPAIETCSIIKTQYLQPVCAKLNL